MNVVDFYVKNKNYKGNCPYDSPVIGKCLFAFYDADFILDALRIHNTAIEWKHISEDDFVTILHLLENWRKCFDTLDFSKLPDYKWESREVYHPAIKSKLDDYISDMEKILKDFDWENLEMTAKIC